MTFKPNDVVSLLSSTRIEVIGEYVISTLTVPPGKWFITEVEKRGEWFIQVQRVG